MNAQNNVRPFKTSVVGGFSRADVLSYIEEQDKRLAEVKRRLEEDVARLNSEVSAMSGRIDAANAEAERAQWDLLNQSHELDGARETLASKDAEMAGLCAEIERVNAENLYLAGELRSETAAREAADGLVRDLREKSDEYDALKTKLYDLELSAAKRADRLEREAMSRVYAVKEALHGLIAEASGRYQVFRRETDQTASLISDELERMRGWFGALRTVLDDVGSKIDTLGAARPDPTEVRQEASAAYETHEVIDAVTREYENA